MSNAKHLIREVRHLLSEGKSLYEAQSLVHQKRGLILPLSLLERLSRVEAEE